jgi:5-methylcytosine-specific restriction endonuclease McrA
MAIIYQDGQPGKICSKCKTWRSTNRYIKRLLSRDGFDSICCECRNTASREWRAKNKQRVQELNREFYEANREHRKAYHRTYRRNNPGYFRAKMLEFRQQNPTYNRDYNREWARSHPDKRAEKDNKRRAFKMGRKTSFTSQEWEVVKRAYNYTCLRCGSREPEIKLTADHVVPISKGGAGTIDNIQPLCKSCNSAKHNQTIDYRPGWKEPRT